MLNVARRPKGRNNEWESDTEIREHGNGDSAQSGRAVQRVGNRRRRESVGSLCSNSELSVASIDSTLSRTTSAAARRYERWQMLARKLCRSDLWLNLTNNVKRALTHLPERISDIYARYEEESGITLEMESKKTY